MAKELFTWTHADVTVYALVVNTVGKVFQTTDNTFVDYATANRANYDVALTEQGTSSGIYAGDMDTDIPAGRYVAGFYIQLGGSPAEGDTFIGTQTLDWTGSAVISLDSVRDVYTAKIACTLDDNTTKDKYTVSWFKNGVAVTSGITSPTLQLVKRSDGTDLLAATAMSQVGTTGVYKYDSASRVDPASNENVIAVAVATIDGASRTDRDIIIRDRTAA